MCEDFQKYVIGKRHVKIKTCNMLHVYWGRWVKIQALFVIMMYTIKK